MKKLNDGNAPRVYDETRIASVLAAMGGMFGNTTNALTNFGVPPQLSNGPRPNPGRTGVRAGKRAAAKRRNVLCNKRAHRRSGR